MLLLFSFTGSSVGSTVVSGVAVGSGVETVFPPGTSTSPMATGTIIEQFSVISKL